MLVKTVKHKCGHPETTIRQRGEPRPRPQALCPLCRDKQRLADA